MDTYSRSVEEKQLLALEMAALRKLLGVHILDKKIRKALNQIQTIMQKVHERQHQWLGHVLRMDKNRIANIALNTRVEGTTKRGRPRITWMSSVLVRYDVGLQVLIRIVQDRDRGLLSSTHVRVHFEVQ